MSTWAHLIYQVTLLNIFLNGPMCTWAFLTKLDYVNFHPIASIFGSMIGMVPLIIVVV